MASSDAPAREPARLPDPTPAAPLALTLALPEDELVRTPEARPVCDPSAPRGAARDQVQAALASERAALEQLRVEARTATTKSAITEADAMLTEIAEKADGFLQAIGCGEAPAGAQAEGVGERTIAAMVTVHELARSLVARDLVTPAPVPVRKPTPAPAWKPNPCDQGLYAAKAELQGAFDRWHGANDRLLSDIRGWASQRSIGAVTEADRVMHYTYDRAREQILRAGCATTTALTIARSAAATFAQAAGSARSVVEAEIAVRRASWSATATPRPTWHR